MSVIDVLLRFSQCRAVLTHDEILAELRRQVEAKAFTQKALADHLGIAPPRIKEILKGERRIQPEEMPRVAEWLGMGGGAEIEAIQHITLPVQIPSVGALTEMFVSMLEQVEIDPHQDERAQKLARNFRGAFQAAVLHQEAQASETEKIPARPPHAGAANHSST